MLKFFLIGLGFMLLIEGLLYFFFPQQMKDMMKAIEKMDIEKIKITATFACLIGACLIYFTIKFY